MSNVAGAPPTPVLYRPVVAVPPAPLVSASLFLGALGSQVGLLNPNNQPLLVVSKTQLRPYLRSGEFNHVATAWRRGISRSGKLLNADNTISGF